MLFMNKHRYRFWGACAKFTISLCRHNKNPPFFVFIIALSRLYFCSILFLLLLRLLLNTHSTVMYAVAAIDTINKFVYKMQQQQQQNKAHETFSFNTFNGPFFRLLVCAGCVFPIVCRNSRTFYAWTFALELLFLLLVFIIVGAFFCLFVLPSIKL